jgi:ribonuclease-3
VAAGPAASNTPDPAIISAALGVELSDELVVLALTHRSFAYENGGLPTNERLEFLGDSVLGVIITDTLYRTHPDLPEGRLAKLRASVVNMHALAGVGRRIGLGQQLRLGRGEEMTGGRDKSSIVADAVEAVIGAVYLQYGLDTTREVIKRLFTDLLVAAPQLGAGLDWKTSLQELSAELNLGVPEYRVSEEGPDHAKVFAAQVLLSGLSRGEGSGRTKKEAEQNAAAAAYTSLQAASAGSASQSAGASVSDGQATPTPTGAPMTDSVAVERVQRGESAGDTASVGGQTAEKRRDGDADPSRPGA